MPRSRTIGTPDMLCIITGIQGSIFDVRSTPAPCAQQRAPDRLHRACARRPGVLARAGRLPVARPGSRGPSHRPERDPDPAPGGHLHRDRQRRLDARCRHRGRRSPDCRPGIDSGPRQYRRRCGRRRADRQTAVSQERRCQVGGRELDVPRDPHER